MATGLNWLDFAIIGVIGLSAVVSLIRRHVAETGSRYAERLLNDWTMERKHFWQVVPNDMIGKLPVATRITSYNVCYTKLLR